MSALAAAATATGPWVGNEIATGSSERDGQHGPALAAAVVSAAASEKGPRQVHRSFWTLLDALGPRAPYGGDIEWAVSLDHALAQKPRTLELSETAVESALASASQWNPGWPWTVERRGDQFRFTQVSW